MSLPPHLSELPRLSDIIRGMEKSVWILPHPQFGPWQALTIVPDETSEPFTQMQWTRYEHYLYAGRNCSATEGGPSFLPVPERSDKDIPPDAEEPFSRLSMMADSALDICGYKQKAGTPDDVRLLAQALEAAARVDLGAIFSAPQPLLSRIRDHTIDYQHVISLADINVLQRIRAELTFRGAEDPSIPRSPGEKAASALRDAIAACLHALHTWPAVVELLDRIDWNDSHVLMNLASDPTFANRDMSNPLCDLMYQVNHHEIVSGNRLRLLFDEWMVKSVPPPTSFPSSWDATQRRAQPEIVERDLQVYKLMGMSRFVKALTRLCRPGLRPTTPAHISLLDFEMLVREKPSRMKSLTVPLVKALGYHYSVVLIHYTLRKFIFDKASACAGWQNFNLEKMTGRPPEDPKKHLPRNTAFVRFIVLHRIGSRPNRTFRDARLSWFLLRFPFFNWANFITLGTSSPVTISYDGNTLKVILDAICLCIWGCSLADLMDAKSDFSEADRSRYTVLSQDSPHADDINAVLDKCRAGAPPPDPVTDFRCLYKLTSRSIQFPTPSQTSTDIADVSGSLPLAQSSHAYLRDNPHLIRPVGIDVAAIQPQALPAEEESPGELVRFRVNSAQLKVAERLFGKRGGDVRWSSLVNLFRRIGYRAEGMGGSAYHIRPIIPGGKSILLYRPHPDPAFTPDQTLAIGEQMTATFGWSIDNFVRQLDEESVNPIAND